MVLVGAYCLNAVFNLVIGLLAAHFLGPVEFGRFALALAAAAAAQLLAFDWLRLSVLRFAAGSVRAGEPALAALNTAFAGLALAAGALAFAAWTLDLDAPLGRPLVALAILAAVANGLFDYRCACQRAWFRDGAYARLMLAKNIFGLVLTVGAAMFTGSANATLAAACVAMAAPAILLVPRVGASSARILWDGPALRRFWGYGGPIVAAGALYAAIPVLNRYALAYGSGYAEAGHFALAHDVGSRLLAAVGAALDVLLFQIAVRADDEQGRTAARAQAARNVVPIVATLAAAALGCWLVLPSLEAAIAPPEYRGPFGETLARLLPGLFCQSVALYALSALFQIEGRTRPLIAAAAAAVAVNAVALMAAGSLDPSLVAVVQSVGFAAAALALAGAGRLVGASAPDLWELARAGLALAAMALVVYPLRGLEPGLSTLAAQVVIGAAVFVGCAAALDVAGVRRILRRGAGATARPGDP